MRPSRKLALLCTLLTASGCRRSYVVPETPMPPNTVLLSQMMRELSAQPGFTETLLAEIDTSGKKGPALLTPTLIDDLRKRILGKDWQGLDRFPGWTMREIDPTVRVIGRVLNKSQSVENLSAVHPGVSPVSTQGHPYLDFGPYSLDHSQTISLDQPSTLPGFNPDDSVSSLGDDVIRGDGPNQLALEHAESQRLADALNRLAANALDGAAPFSATFSGQTATTPQQLIAALAANGYQITVADARYFANFGHFHYKRSGSDIAEDVMMPFWVNTEIIVPHSGGRPLLVPVAHAEYEWRIRPPRGGPGINADISYYFGVDGKSEFRTMDTLDQAWVLGRYAHEYTGTDAIEVTRLAGLLTIAYMHQHIARPQLPFGGYYALGVCQDGISAIEQRMTGHSTLFPNTADTALFNDPRDAEINRLLESIPKDRGGIAPEPERIFGSLPTTDLARIALPGLAADLTATEAAWRAGALHRTRSIRRILLTLAPIAAAALFAVFAFGYLRRRRSTTHPI
jgi:hypothetical protein